MNGYSVMALAMSLAGGMACRGQSNPLSAGVKADYTKHQKLFHPSRGEDA